MPTVQNSNASLEGKTLLTTENNDTITGAKTFDRDPAAPFIVTPGSAKVDNLDADKLDGEDGAFYRSLTNATNWDAASLAWQDYTPTIANVTVGNGTVTGRYVQIGKLVVFRVKFILGSTSAVSGAVLISLPVPAAATYSGFAFGVGQLFNAGVSSHPATIRMGGTPLSAELRVHAVSGSVVAESPTGPSTPFSWGVADVLTVQGVYEAA